ncbi:hypothetical protein AVEN_77425-1 [Araneus ventricosus]|uniref:Uncharacterized protein n=1 Tax=Araneus ventricosus TaxID=182803 RepID=A0A4Y2WND4_ARAVE|nr:hypothetical protein AVEN_272156-1 [Araneus ventricosus]GBO38658.1 hypothetical protein AVEN_48219-1 [Araneus ventricosus]GBO38659.1 hypothetical protein AVEN_61633-1 [Araneus ventricosus]GBO38660.1 hypothetical protein AVEN_77425-1 [Araneus ventricosus]
MTLVDSWNEMDRRSISTRTEIVPSVISPQQDKSTGDIQNLSVDIFHGSREILRCTSLSELLRHSVHALPSSLLEVARVCDKSFIAARVSEMSRT